MKLLITQTSSCVRTFAQKSCLSADGFSLRWCLKQLFEICIVRTYKELSVQPSSYASDGRFSDCKWCAAKGNLGGFCYLRMTAITFPVYLLNVQVRDFTQIVSLCLALLSVLFSFRGFAVEALL